MRADPRPDADPSPATRRARRLTNAEIDTLVERYETLRSLRVLATETGLDRGTLRRHLKARGVTFEEKPSMAPAQITRAIALYEAGRSSGAIGRELGFDNKTVLTQLRRAGVVIRDRGRPRK